MTRADRIATNYYDPLIQTRLELSLMLLLYVKPDHVISNLVMEAIWPTAKRLREWCRDCRPDLIPNAYRKQASTEGEAGYETNDSSEPGSSGLLMLEE